MNSTKKNPTYKINYRLALFMSYKSTIDTPFPNTVSKSTVKSSTAFLITTFEEQHVIVQAEPLPFEHHTRRLYLPAPCF